MGIILDILILLIFLLFILKNYRRSQIRCALETCCYVLAAGFSVPIAKMLAELCYTKLFRSALAHNLDPVLSATAHLSGNYSNYDRVMEKMPSVVRFAADSYQIGTPENVAEVERLVLGNPVTAATQITDILAQPVITGIFRAVFCVIFFCGLLYLLKSFASIIENAMYTPDRASQNTVLCSVFGCFKALVTVSVIVALIQFILPALPRLPFFNTDTFGKSFIFRMFYYQNVLMLFLGQGVYPVSL